MTYMLRKTAMAIQPRTKPPKPPESQTVPCPSGMIGTGLQQTRVCTFDYGLAFNWSCTEWQTISQDCRPAQIVFVTPDQFFDPPLSGSGFEEGQEQTYGPTTVNNGGYAMTLQYHVYVTDAPPPPPGAIKRTSDMTVTFVPAPPAGSSVEIAWNRDYANFDTKPVGAGGVTEWLDVPNSEWTVNSTQFTVTLIASA